MPVFLVKWLAFSWISFLLAFRSIFWANFFLKHLILISLKSFPFILRVSGTIGTFFFFSSAPSMVPAGKEKGDVFETVSKVSNINLKRFEILIYFFLMKKNGIIIIKNYRIDKIACVCYSLYHLWLFVTPGTVACQAPLSMEFSKQEYWSGLPFLSPGDLPDPEMKPDSPALQYCTQILTICTSRKA